MSFYILYNALMKLADWARQQGIRYKTAYKWFHKGILPVPARQLPTGTILVDVSPNEGVEQVALYARVSSADQKADLDRQLGRLSIFAAERGFHVVKTAQEIGSGLNGQRPQLLGLLRNPAVTAIIVEHRDRLARFGSEYIEAALQATGRTTNPSRARRTASAPRSRSPELCFPCTSPR